MPLRAGDMTGDYRVLALIGSGGMGHVYKVQNILSNRIEAMKVVLPDKADELTERFLREIQVQASLVHPNITGLHTALRVEGQLIMIMELVEGETLKDRLEHGPLRIGECVEYGRQVLDALAYAHRHHVVHRDIKPANIMLSTSGQAKLMDFGLASAGFDKRLTRTGTVMGSLYYMAPEQVKGQQLTSRSDLYSFGLTLYEMLTGVRGIQGDSDYAIMTAHLEKVPQAPMLCNPLVPRYLSDMVLRAVAKDPAERFETAEAFRDALEQFARLAPEPAMESTAVQAAMPPVPVIATPREKTAEALPEREPDTLVQAPRTDSAPDVPTMTMNARPAAPSASSIDEPAVVPLVAAAAATMPEAAVAPSPSVPPAPMIPVQNREDPIVRTAKEERLAGPPTGSSPEPPSDIPEASAKHEAVGPQPLAPQPFESQPIARRADAPNTPASQPKRKPTGMLIVVGAAAAAVLATIGIYRFATGPAAETPVPPANESVAEAKTAESIPETTSTAKHGAIASAIPESTRVVASSASSKNGGASSKADTAPASPKQTVLAAGSSVAAPAPTKGTPSAQSANVSVAPAKTPQVGNSLVTNAPFVPATAPVVVSAPVSAAPVVEVPKPPQKNAEQLRAEEAARAWELIASSNDPAVLRSFHSRYPQSVHAAEALNAAEKLENQAAAEATARKASETVAALRQEVASALRRLEQGYSAKNLAQIRVVWPGIDGEHAKRLEQAFRESQTVSLSLDPTGDPRPTQRGGVVECRYVLMFPLKNNKTPRQMEGIATVHLARTGGALVVDAIEYRMTSRSLFKPL